MFNIVLMFALFLDKGPEILNFVGIRYVARNMIGLFFKRTDAPANPNSMSSQSMTFFSTIISQRKKQGTEINRQKKKSVRKFFTVFIDV